MSAIIPDPEDIGKLFVGGLSSSTTKESLHNYFGQFGDVVDSVVMKNNETGRSRGFGFVTFKEPNCIFKALQVQNHELDGKKIDPKECTPRSMQKTRKQASKCKVFLGGLPPDISEEAIRNGMSKFGKVDQVVIMYDQETKKCRGFGFLSFELEESIDQACAERYVNINGKQIECKRAEPRLNPKRLESTFPKNGIEEQTSYVHVSPVQQNNWNMQPSHLYNMQGNSYATNYPNYAQPGMVVPFSATAACYPNLQSLPYGQTYPSSSVGSYNYSPVPANPYPQTTFTISATTPDISGPTVAYNAETGKSTGSNDYSQSVSSYGPTKSTFGANATNVAYNSQGAVASANYQRFHPYKV